MFSSKVYYSPWQQNNSTEKHVGGEERKGNYFPAVGVRKSGILLSFLFVVQNRKLGLYLITRENIVDALSWQAYFRIVIVSVECHDDSRVCAKIFVRKQGELALFHDCL